MRWKIIGADRATGEDRVVTVEASDERAALLSAKEFNLLVAEVQQEVIPPQPVMRSVEKLDYTSQDLHKIAAASAQIPRSPKYEEIPRCASDLKSLSLFFSALGWICLVLACLSITMGIYLMNQPRNTVGDALVSWYLLGCGLYFFTAMVILFTIRAFMRMTAAAGLALRDLAVNSFKR